LNVGLNDDAAVGPSVQLQVGGDNAAAVSSPDPVVGDVINSSAILEDKILQLKKEIHKRDVQLAKERAKSKRLIRKFEFSVVSS
jgi:hypothetical protein